MKEREIEIRKRQLEEQEMRIKLQQQQLIFQQQQQHQQMLLQQQQNYQIQPQPNNVSTQATSPQNKPPKLEDSLSQIDLSDLKPEAIYKPGFFSQLKLPPAMPQPPSFIPPAVVPAQIVPPPTNFIVSNSINSQCLAPTLVPNVSKPSSLNNQSVSPQLSYQTPTTIPVKQVQPVQPLQQQPPKKTAYDDLMDIFGPGKVENSNTQNTSGILEPVRKQ